MARSGRSIVSLAITALFAATVYLLALTPPAAGHAGDPITAAIDMHCPHGAPTTDGCGGEHGHDAEGCCHTVCHVSTLLLVASIHGPEARPTMLGGVSCVGRPLRRLARIDRPPPR